ncbi:hypothetical protein [Elongatibacter sediminis]
MRAYPRFLRLTAAVLLLLLYAIPVDLVAQSGTPSGETAEILVYKKWIGASGNEEAVEAHLLCENDVRLPPLRVHRDRPEAWLLSSVPDEGILCSVLEVERDTFVADMEDCRDLLVVPGRGAECTLVNTKVVKRIDMLNRYGLVMMIAVMLGAGLAAVHRHTRL